MTLAPSSKDSCRHILSNVLGYKFGFQTLSKRQGDPPGPLDESRKSFWRAFCRPNFDLSNRYPIPLAGGGRISLLPVFLVVLQNYRQAPTDAEQNLNRELQSVAVLAQSGQELLILHHQMVTMFF